MNQTRTIRLPIHVVKELNVYLRTARELSHRLDHEPTAEDIAFALDRSVDDVNRMLKLNEKITSVDTLSVAIATRRCWMCSPTSAAWALSWSPRMTTCAPA